MKVKLIICMTCLMAPVFTVQVFGQDATFTGDVEKVKVISTLTDHPGAPKVLIPHIVEWKANHLVVAYEVGIAGKTDMGDIVSLVSTNDGDTWGGQVMIFDHREKHGVKHYAYANPILYKIPGQNLLWCFAMRNPLYQRNSEESQMVAAYSGDGGRSWNEVELIMHYAGSLVLAGNVLQIMEDQGEIWYLLPAHRNAVSNGPVGGNREHFVLKSKNLLEWEVAGYIPQPDDVWVHEGHIAPGEKAGELIMVMRTADHANQALSTPRAWSSKSTDFGRTWSYPKEEPELYNAVSEAAFGKTVSGTYYYIYNDGPAKGVDSRQALRYKVKRKGGAWSGEKTFYDSGTKNSYPSVIEVKPGELRIVWDSGTRAETRTQIVFGKLRME
ncbi:sialidase family protein [Parapedobacter sp. 2B3]|uniref:sialidase family protein n=1 Tax=Parapedobacter sp. 2B3 TaxID=3342381 RepID=UPI0035B59347